MYGLPKGFNGSFLVDGVFEMVCFSQNQVCLHFSNEVMVTIEGSFSFSCPQSEDVERVMDVPVHQSALMTLLGASVSEVQGSEDGTLQLFLDNGYVLKCYDSLAPQYESYRIRCGDKVIIV